MKKFRTSIVCRVLSLMAVSLFVLPLNGGSVFAEEKIKATTEVKHKPMDYFVPEKRIEVAAEVVDAAGINIVRCYFRALEQADYLFVAMKPGSSLYRGVLPAPSKETETIEYLFLAVNGKNEVVRTQTFEAHKKDKDEAPAWQQVSPEGDIHVTTELAQAPQAPVGFTDSIAVDIAESSARFGFVVGGIYTALQASESGGTTGTAAAAQDAGTISAKTGGLSTLAYVGGAALLVGGVAAAAGGGGGGGGGGDGDGTTTSTTTTPTTTIGPTTSTTTSEGGGGGLSDVTVNSRNVDLAFWDCGAPPCENDGDVIDARLNGFPVLFYQRLTPSETTRRVTLNPGQNTLVIIARQDGACSGNTACLRISNVSSGDAVQGWQLSAVGFDGAPSSASMTISAPSTSPTTTTSLTTTSTTTSQTTTPTTTTTTSTTTTPIPTTSTSTINPCAGNSPPSVNSVSFSPDSTLCEQELIQFVATGSDADGAYDIQTIQARLVNQTKGTQYVLNFTPQPTGNAQNFTITRSTGFRVGYVGDRYCIYVRLLDKCGHWSNEKGACVYSQDCHQSPYPDYDY